MRDAGKRQALFQGKSSCHSPKPGEEKTAELWASDGQLMTIFGVMGSPSEAEVAKVMDAEARTYLQSMEKHPRKELSDVLPLAAESALDLLDRMLKFDPDERCAVDEAITHPYFEDNPHGDLREGLDIVPKHKVELDFDDDIEKWGESPSAKSLKWRMVKEIKNYHDADHETYGD